MTSSLLLFYSLPLLLLSRWIRAAARQINESEGEPFVSIVLAARNAGESALNCLHALLEQNYPRSQYEIIIVDDQSTDGTFDLLTRFAQMHPVTVLQNLRRGKYRSAKKSALELGVARAQGEIVLFTDADCLPGKNWLRGMVDYFDEETGLVAGFSPQIAEKKMTSHLLTLDAGAAAFVAAATVSAGHGITCSGRNLAYRKEAFMDAGGFAAAPDSLSGDDDFILQAISRHARWKVRYALTSSTAVPSMGPENVRAFLRQKERHLSAGKYFPGTAQVGFVLFHLANAVIWFAAVVGILRAPLLLLPLAAKCAVDYAVLRWFLQHFTIQIYWPGFLLWEPLYFYYNCISGPVGLLKKERW